MPFVDTLRQWDEAVTLADKKNLPEALRTFLAIEEPNSKIYFNIGCLHILNRDFDAAEKAFDSSIRKDEHLAVAFFQRGNTFYKKESFEECLGDFTNAHKALRGNQMIDYKALGLRYKLHACEVLHNMALAEAHLGNWKNAQQNLMKALDYKTESKLIDKAYQSILKQKLFKLVEFPSSELFRPNKHYVAELEKKDYLGKAKVVSSVIPQDMFSGFAPLQPQVKDGPTSPKEPEVLKALEGKPHTVLFEFFPETSDELAVVPGNIVFLLQKGADNWASVVFNGRKGLVPYNYLQPLNISPTSKRPEGLNTPPVKSPPIRPKRNVDQSPVVKSKADKNDTESEDNNCIVKVHFTFTIAISIPLGSSYAALIGKISKKLELETTPLTLSLTPEATGDGVIDADTDMTRVWNRAKDGRLTMWCKIYEPSRERRVCFVALHTYDSSNPEDLSFQEGDKILLLSRINQDWIEGQCGENVGIFPASFVEEQTANEQ
ncbi:neutrophil cytosol factor 2 [Eucyclogobius newberryi]|uniref:neutrophil cytosol factor 2 n=1 Tax=Eucyclogobius newberryi TaxID=166745 RepID=UPI003B5C731F